MKGFGFRTLATILIVFHTMQTYGITLFKNGRSDYLIVVSPKASVSEKNAAKELQDYLKQIGGVNLPISHQAQTNGKHIYVGYNNYLKKMTGVPRPDADDEGFTYRTIGDNLCIWGGSERGTMYGVFTFLERELGVRWYAKDCTIIPPQKTVSLGILNHSEKPAVKYRYDEFYGFFSEPEFYAHNKMNMLWESTPNQYGNFNNYWGCHTSFRLVSPDKYFSTHPEYFSMRNGRRIANGQLCLSSPEVLRIATEYLQSQINPLAGYWCYDVSQNDNLLFCECRKCKKLEQKYGGHSGIWIWFINQIAEKLPDIMLGTFAYQYTTRPPKNIVPRENIVIRLCTTDCCFAHPLESCPENREFMEALKDWSRLTRHLYIWDYTVNFSHFLAPFPNFDVLASNIKTFKKYGAIAIHEEGEYKSGMGEFSEMKGWVLSKLLWNPEQNTDALIDEFLHTYYKEAAEEIKKYYNLYKNLVRPNLHMGIYANCTKDRFPKEFVDSSLNILTAALKKCNNDIIRRRVERVYLQPLYVQNRIYRIQSIASGNYQRMMNIIKQQKPYINEGTNAKEFIMKHDYT
ncbi:MAG: DUF4838 domain-containing protein [Prevotella sp.]|nr:DUF4838 domain-containing protein [Prevotella sp.]